MRIAIGSDHAGYEQKRSLSLCLSSLEHEVVDEGTYSDERCDYPDFAEAVARDVADGKADRGVLVCGTGIGMAIAADKVTGIRAATVTTVDFAKLARKHNDLNVICLSGRFVDPSVNEEIVKAFLSTKFEGGRHAMRVAKIMRLDADPTRPTVFDSHSEEPVLPVTACCTVDVGTPAGPR
jgi:ribose 5-phosphate isomerase B